MVDSVTTIVTTDAISSTTRLHSGSRAGLLASLLPASGRRCLIGGIMFNKGREFTIHMSHRHRAISTGVSRPKVSGPRRGVVTAGGVPWASTVSSDTRTRISPTCLHREDSRTSRKNRKWCWDNRFSNTAQKKYKNTKPTKKIVKFTNPKKVHIEEEEK